MSVEREWRPIATAPNDVTVETAIIDMRGQRKTRPLRKTGALWFYPDGSMHVYYQPTHWREYDEAAAEGLILSWVSARMAAEVKRRRGIRISTCRYRGFEGMDPPTGPVWDGLADDDREALSRAVMLDLGLDGPAGEHGTAWTLCERAGWPS